MPSDNKSKYEVWARLPVYPAIWPTLQVSELADDGSTIDRDGVAVHEVSLIAGKEHHETRYVDRTTVATGWCIHGDVVERATFAGPVRPQAP